MGKNHDNLFKLITAVVSCLIIAIVIAVSVFLIWWKLGEAKRNRTRCQGNHRTVDGAIQSYMSFFGDYVPEELYA